MISDSSVVIMLVHTVNMKYMMSTCSFALCGTSNGLKFRRGLVYSA